MIDFTGFCDREIEGLARYARLLSPDRFQAQDLLQEALISAHQRWHRIGDMDHPAAYVRSIITSKHLREARRWSVRNIRVTGSGRLPEATTPDPTRMVDDRHQLIALLDSLTPRQRSAVVLRHFLGLSDEEIAAELDITASTVRSLISRALSSMRPVLVAGIGKETT